MSGAAESSVGQNQFRLRERRRWCSREGTCKKLSQLRSSLDCWDRRSRRFILNQRDKGFDCKQSFHVTHDHARLLTAGGNHHNRCPLAGAEMGAVVTKGGEDSDQREGGRSGA